MIRRIICITVLLVALCASAGAEKFPTYEMEHFTFRYPPGWTASSEPGAFQDAGGERAFVFREQLTDIAPEGFDAALGAVADSFAALGNTSNIESEVTNVQQLPALVSTMDMLTSGELYRVCAVCLYDSGYLAMLTYTSGSQTTEEVRSIATSYAQLITMNSTDDAPQPTATATASPTAYTITEDVATYQTQNFTFAYPASWTPFLGQHGQYTNPEQTVLLTFSEETDGFDLRSPGVYYAAMIDLVESMDNVSHVDSEEFDLSGCAALRISMTDHYDSGSEARKCNIYLVSHGSLVTLSYVSFDQAPEEIDAFALAYAQRIEYTP